MIDDLHRSYFNADIFVKKNNPEFNLIICVKELIKTKIYFHAPLKCKMNSNNCENIYVD